MFSGKKCLMDYEVVVIGAGVAGLVAARDLARSGRSVAVLEARDRVRPPVTYALLREYGATVVDDAEESFVFRDDALQRATADPFAAVGEMLASALERAEDESVDALIARASQDQATRATGRWARRLVSGFDAADTTRASARAIAREWSGDASADGAQSRPLVGYAPLVAHLARSLDPARVDLRLRAIVTQVARDARGVQIRARSPRGEVSFHARRALVTVPHGVLAAQPGAEGAIAFEPPLPAATNEALARIVNGPVVKVVLSFRTAFWETLNGGAWRDGAFFNGDGTFPTLWTQLPVRANTLVAWAGGSDAERLANTGHNERTALALACAGRYFGAAAAAEDSFECAYAHDWQRDPFARGAYSYVLVGGEHARATLAAPIDGALWFAGEATASQSEGGTVAGALESGMRAAREIIAAPTSPTESSDAVGLR
jgi:predicted NAD/FAD-dependent oxidoreductase